MSSLHYHGDVMGKPRMTQRDKWKKRDVVQRYNAFKDSIRLQARQQGFTLGGSFTAIFYIPVPRSWSRKKKEEKIMEPHRQRPDLDNLEKALMDALLPEDSAVWSVSAKKVWTEEGNAGISIMNREEL